ncbi:MAG: electron transport complex subunit RsxE [Clostridiaceae bacterium]|nr:electron transport complex subunit RsxE [Clostridiaceae bacterium]
MRILLDGVLFENPALRLILGTCPLLAITISAKSSFFMGLAVIFVLVGSEFIISLLKNMIPPKVRIPAFITIIAAFVTIVEFVISAYLPALNDSLSIYIQLIVVNCVVLARAEAFASKRPAHFAALDGFSMGVGFMLALVLIGSIREIVGAGTIFDIGIPIFGKTIFGEVIEPIAFFTSSPGGFFVYGLLICLSQVVMRQIEKNRKHKTNALNQPITSGSGCSSCGACPMADLKAESGVK